MFMAASDGGTLMVHQPILAGGLTGSAAMVIVNDGVYRDTVGYVSRLLPWRGACVFLRSLGRLSEVPFNTGETDDQGGSDGFWIQDVYRAWAAACGSKRAAARSGARDSARADARGSGRRGAGG